MENINDDNTNQEEQSKAQTPPDSQENDKGVEQRAQPVGKMFTEEEVNTMIQERLDRFKEDRITEAVGERTKELTDKYAQSQSGMEKLQRANMVLEVSRATGISDTVLQGYSFTTKEELEKVAADLQAEIDRKAQLAASQVSGDLKRKFESVDQKGSESIGASILRQRETSQNA
jgi:hypothetical protein